MLGLILTIIGPGLTIAVFLVQRKKRKLSLMLNLANEPFL